MPARSNEHGHLVDDDHLCPAELNHVSEGFVNDFWLCDRPDRHVGRHHAIAWEASISDGYDRAEVEIYWPNDTPQGEL